MTIDGATITWLIVGAVILSVLAVVLDRVNFPQKPFRARQIVSDGSRAPRDRTGAHLIDEDGEDEAGDQAIHQLGGRAANEVGDPDYRGQPGYPWDGR